MTASFAAPSRMAPAATAKKAPRSSLISKNVVIKGRRTSVRMDPVLWESLWEISRRQAVSIHDLCTVVAENKLPYMSVTTAIRVFIVSYFREAATEDGHIKAGHILEPESNTVQKLVQTSMA